MACTLAHTKRPTHPCEYCQKPTRSPRFCSRSCATIYTNKEKPKHKRTLKCSCGNLRLARHKRCPECIKKGGGGSWPLDALKNRTLAEVLEMPSVKGKHPSWAYSHIRQLGRKWNSNLLKLPCQNCGYSKHVELCHIKPITSFPKTTTIGEVNDPSNLITLCRNCHWEFDNNLLDLPGITKNKFENNRSKIIFTKPKKKISCLVCNTLTENKKYCSYECSHYATRRVIRPEKEKLKELLEHESFSSISRMYGVSDNAIRKWLKE